LAEPVRVTLLAGGVGGAKMAEGFAALDAVDLTVIGNVADDDWFHGLWVSPDIDTVTYTLADEINRDQGWGVRDEGRRALDVLTRLGADTWMFLGDKDFGLHIYRTDRLRRGDRPSVIAGDIAGALGVGAKIVLPTDDRVQTRVRTAAGWQSFQEYFVRDQCAPEVLELDIQGLDTARPTAEALQAIAAAELIVIAPSNPLVSIAPILGVSGLRAALGAAKGPVLAVSPLIAGRVVKGPADRMMTSLGHRADVVGVARLYADLADSLLIDAQDRDLGEAVAALGVAPVVTDILMPDLDAKRRLAQVLLAQAGLSAAEAPA